MMRSVIAVLAALFVMMALLMSALYMGNSKPEQAPLRNAYYPFTVELQVRDL